MKLKPTLRASMGEIMVALGDGLDEEGLRLSPVVEQRNHVENSTDDRTVCTLGKSEASGAKWRPPQIYKLFQLRVWYR